MNVRYQPSITLVYDEPKISYIKKAVLIQLKLNYEKAQTYRVVGAPPSLQSALQDTYVLCYERVPAFLFHLERQQLYRTGGALPTLSLVEPNS